MGGRTAEHEISLESGKEVLEALDKNKYRVKPMKIKKTGEWIIPQGYIDTCKEGIVSLIDDNGTSYKMKVSDDNWPVLSDGNIEKLKKSSEDKVDVVFIVLHGPFGEDGTVQGLLELMDIPYTGSNVLCSALAMNKAKCKEIYIYNNIKVPDFIVCYYQDWHRDSDKIIKIVEDKINYPCVIKPSSMGSSVGTYIVKERNNLKDKISRALEYDNTILIEEYIKGTEITCAVLGSLHGEEPEALPLTEIIPPEHVEFFDYNVKYDGSTREITPARISQKLTLKAQEIGVYVHKILTCSGMSRTDMIIREEDIYVLETNTIPGMTKNSLYPQAAIAAGMTFSELLDRLIELALDVHKHKKIKVERK